MAFFRVRSIRSFNRWNSTGFTNAIRRGLQDVGIAILSEYKRTINTWVNKPKFVIEINNTSNGIGLFVGTGDDIYRFLDDGTSIRWARMTNDFKAKTAIGIIGSSAGAGGVRFRGKSSYMARGIKQPDPGIEAREFTITIADFIRPYWRERMREAGREGVAAMNRGE